MNILNRLEKNSELFPDKHVYTYVERDGAVSEQLTYQKLALDVQKISSLLNDRYHPGQRVLILLPAGASFIQFFLACLQSELIAVPCPIGFSESGIRRILNILDDSGTSCIITNQKTHKMLFQRPNNASDALRELPVEWIFTDIIDVDSLHPTTIKKELNSDEVAYLQYTSGSTNRPKGVMISHTNLMANLSAINNCFGRTPADTSVTWLPHYHDMGLVDGLLSPLYTGGSGVVISPLVFISRPFLLLETLSRFKAGFCGGPGFGLDQCVARSTPELLEGIDLSSMRVLYVGAEPIRISTLETFAEKMRGCGFRKESLVPAYGLAEATLAVSLHINGTQMIYRQVPQDINSKVVVACGPPVEKTEVRIVSPSTKSTLPDNEVGEIWVKNAGVALGYWQNKEATDEVFKAYTSEGDGPFLITGDLGFMSGGYLFITGRSKELIIIRGVNYYPQDIEEVVSECHDAIQPHATAAFAIDTPGGEALGIVSELKRGMDTDDKIEEVSNKAAQTIGLAFGLLVHKIVLIQTGRLPKTSSGKIQRLLARRIFVEEAD